MRYNIYENGGAVEGLVTISGMTVTGYITLRGDPIDRMEAVSKQYVDFLASTVRSNNVLSGTFNKAQLPAFTGGQVTSVAGNNVLAITPTGVAPNTYTKITVGVNGLVTSGSNLTPTDIPSISFSKITTGKPTTLAGYGITDSVSRVNGAITGNLTLSGAPIAATDVATKQYTDNKTLNYKTYQTGDLITGSYDIPPTGFLRCNGGEISKMTYPALFAIIGEKYGSSVSPSTGQPWRHQYGFNLTNPTVGPFTVDDPTIYPFCLTQVVATKNRVYVLGSYIYANSQTNQIWTAVIDENGEIGPFVQAGVMPYACYWAYAVIIKDILYVFGGAINGTDGVYSVVQRAPVNPDGTLGAWSIHPINLPVNMFCHKLLVTTDKLYVISAQETWYCVISETGEIGNWIQGTSLDSYAFRNDVFITKNRIYSVGGYNPYGTTMAIIQTAPIDNNGIIGQWVSDATGMGNAIHGTTTVTTRDRVFTIGGSYGFYSPVNTVRTAPINADGTLGSWSSLPSLPAARSYISAVITSSKLYLFGMFDGYYGSTTVWSCPFTGGANDYRPYQDGTITSVNNPNNFRLPDFSSVHEANNNVFVKF